MVLQTDFDICIFVVLLIILRLLLNDAEHELLQNLFFVLVSVNYSLAATGILFFMAIFGFIFHVWTIIDAARYKG